MSRRRLWIVFGLIGFLLLVALGDAYVFGGVPLPAPVAETSWTLQRYTSGGADMSLPTGAPVTLTFHRVGHTFNGSDGCNSYTGSFTSLWPGRLSLDTFAVTLVGCVGSIGGLEAGYLADLPKVERYRTSSGGLILSGDGGQLEMDFTAGGA